MSFQVPRPKKLQTTVVEQVGGSIALAARDAYADVILEKLDEQAVLTDDFPIGAFIDHIGSDKRGTCSWGSNTDSDRVVTISFTKEEEHELVSYIRELSEPTHVAELVQEGIQIAGRSLLRTLEKGWPEQQLHEDSELYGFRKRIEATWGEPLDLFRIMLVAIP